VIGRPQWQSFVQGKAVATHLVIAHSHVFPDNVANEPGPHNVNPPSCYYRVSPAEDPVALVGQPWPSVDLHKPVVPNQTVAFYLADPAYQPAHHRCVHG